MRSCTYLLTYLHSWLCAYKIVNINETINGLYKIGRGLSTATKMYDLGWPWTAIMHSRRECLASSCKRGFSQKPSRHLAYIDCWHWPPVPQTQRSFFSFARDADRHRDNGVLMLHNLHYQVTGDSPGGATSNSKMSKLAYYRHVHCTLALMCAKNILQFAIYSGKCRVASFIEHPVVSKALTHWLT